MTTNPDRTRPTPAHKENTVTKTAPSMSASEARALADKLEAEERDLTERRRAARISAESDACRAMFDHADHVLEPARVAAAERWAAATHADVLDHGELFAAFNEMRAATMARIHTLRSADGLLNAIKPRYHERSGQPIAYRADVHDADAGAVWSEVLDRVTREHLDWRAAVITAQVNATVQDAGRAAADAIH